MQILLPTLTSKIIKILACISLALLIISSRLFYLQILLSPNLYHQSQKNFLRFEKIQSPRGNILDRSGNLLATNRPVFHLSWQGSGKNRLSNEQLEGIAKLEKIIDKELLTNQTLLNTIKYAEKHYQVIHLESDISYEQLSQIEENFPNHINITITTQFKRYYPYATLASHILGYLGQIN